MKCPSVIARVLAEILRTGLLRMRVLDDARRSRLEADHLHNLPSLLIDFKPELLHYYWTVERVYFIEHSATEDIQPFEPLWNALAEYVDEGTKSLVAGR